MKRVRLAPFYGVKRTAAPPGQRSRFTGEAKVNDSCLQSQNKPLLFLRTALSLFPREKRPYFSVK